MFVNYNLMLNVKKYTRNAAVPQGMGEGDPTKTRKKEQHLLQGTALGVTEKCLCRWLPAWCFDYYEIDAADLQ